MIIGVRSMTNAAEVLVVNSTVFWPFLSKVNDMSGKFQVDLGCLSDAAVGALEMAGLGVKNKGDDRKNFITVKSNYPIRVFDTLTKDEIEGSLVGNGSEGNFAVSWYDWNFKGKEGRSPNIKRALISKLETYESGGADDVPDELMDEAL
jgi:hypothetical protein